MERDPQEVIRELQEKLEAERRGRLEERRGRLEERRGRFEEEERRVAAENLAKETAFIPFLSHCYRLLFQPVSVQKVTGLHSSGGFTSVHGRYYPRELRPWRDFLGLHGEAFGELEALFGDQRLFPSQIAIDQVQRDLSPSPLANEEDLRPFEVAAIELRAKNVIEKYLSMKPQDVSRVIFRSNPYSLRKHNVTEADRDQGQSRSQSRGRSQNPDSQASGLKRPATSPPPDSSRHSSPKRSSSVERRIVPDRWCLAQNAEKVRRALFTVEYKAGHKAMPETLLAVLDGRPSDVAIFADAAAAMHRAEEKRQRSKLGNVASAEEADAGKVDNENRQQSRSPSPSLRTARNRTAQILTQAFHYMVDSGLSYSYVSTGESLILLHIDYEDDPSVLYYHLSVPKKEIHLPGLQEDSTGYEPIVEISAATAKQTPIALVLTLILLALRKMPLTFEAKEQVKKLIKAFPEPYDSTAGLSGQEAKEGGGQDNNSSGNSNSNGNSSSIVTNTARPPQQSYCTQKCLCGLRFGRGLDQACPNIALHRCSGDADGHGITPAELLLAVEEQLASNLDDGCASLDGHGKFGAIGALFKVTAYPQGYTFVAKGVQDDDREYLDWEERVYRQLVVLQGSVVPVCLGLVDLRRAYVLTGGARVSRLMLLSYAGETAQPEQVDEEVEAELTKTLWAHGVEHGDLRLANVLWSEEQCRLMVIDFDRAILHTKRKRSVDGIEPRQDKKPAWNE